MSNNYQSGWQGGQQPGWNVPTQAQNPMNEELGHELNWDDEIVKENEFVLLPEGEYNFVVEKYERARFNGSAKMAPCNQAKLFIQVIDNGDPNKKVTVIHNLFLNSKCEPQISAFFLAIGAKKKGEPLKMNWNLVPGAKGRCKVGVRTYNGNQYNEIKRFLEPSLNINDYGQMPF